MEDGAGNRNRDQVSGQKEQNWKNALVLLSLVHSLPKPDRRFWDAVKESTCQTRTIQESPWE
jgi:hypothetical protein